MFDLILCRINIFLQHLRKKDKELYVAFELKSKKSESEICFHTPLFFPVSVSTQLNLIP